jgi:hypothetical protein
MQPGQLLVFEQRRDGLVIDVPEDREPGRRQPDSVGGECLQQLRRRVGVDWPGLSAGAVGAERRGDACSQLGEPCGPLSWHRWPRPEQVGQQGVVHLGPPGQAGQAHFRRDKRAGGLGRDQQAEPVRMLVGRDPPQLVGVHIDEGVHRGTRVRALGCASLRQVEQPLLVGARRVLGCRRDAVCREQGPGILSPSV